MAGLCVTAVLGAWIALAIVVSDAPAARDDVVLVSRASGARGAAGSDSSAGPSVSGDGRFVAFQSRADNLSDEDNDAVINLYVRDLEAGTTTLVGRASGPAGAPSDGASNQPSISADGRFVAFTSDAFNLSDEDAAFADVYVRDLQTSTTTLVARATATATVDGPVADALSGSPSISADGRFVAFESAVRNLSGDDSDATSDVYVRDLQARTTTLASRASDAAGGAAADQSVLSSVISGDGRFVAFASDATNLDQNNLNVRDIFVRDTHAGTTSLVSRASGPAGTPSDGPSNRPSISADGRFIAFESAANTLTNTAGQHIYVRDQVANVTALVSRAGGAAGAAADGESHDAALSGDGRLIAFDSMAGNLSDEDNDAVFDVFARDMLGALPGAVTPPATPASGTAGPVPGLRPDTVGPVLGVRALNRANRAIRVGRDGRFRLFCGRFAEPVTGRCGGAGKLRARRFDLGMRAFNARAGARAVVRFRLSRTNLKRLRAARTVRLNGRVVARDARGNATTVRFRFTLKASRSRR